MLRSMILLALLGLTAAWSGYYNGGYYNSGYASPIVADQDSPYHITSDAFESNRREFFSPRYNTNSRSTNYYYPRRDYNYGGGNYSPYYDESYYSGNKYGYDYGRYYRYRPNNRRYGYYNDYDNYGYGGYNNGYYNNGYYNNYDYGYNTRHYGGGRYGNRYARPSWNTNDYWSYSQTPSYGKGGFSPSNAYGYY